MISAIKSLVGWKAYAVAGVGGVILGAGAAWAAQGWRYGERIALIERDQAQAWSIAAAQALASSSRLAALEHAHNEIVRLEHEKESALATAVDAGRVRLHVNATCPSMPEATDAGLGNGTRPELAAAARQDYHALRAGLIKTRADLDLCRASVRELTKASELP